MRWVRWGMACLVGIVLVVAIGGWLLLDRVDLGAWAGRRATAALGRSVSFGAVNVTPGRWASVVVRDAALANAEGGTRPTMARLASGTAEVQLWPLLHGALVLRNVRLDGLDVLLERIEGRGPNWHLKPEAPKPGRPGQDPPRDGSFPLLTDLRVQGRIVARTSAGTELPIGLEGTTFSAPALDRPTRLAGNVTYKGVPIQLDSVLGSVAEYRDAARPFPTRLDLVSGTTRLHFDGTMTDPLGLDGAHGTLQIEAPTPEVLLHVAGASPAPGPSIRLAGQLEHTGPLWQLSQAQGALGTSRILDGTLRLEEGERPGETAPLPPDRLGIIAQVDRLDLDALTGGKQDSGGADMSLKVDPAPATLIAAKLMAHAVTYGGVTVTDVTAEGSQTQGAVAVKSLALSYLGGRMEAAGQATAAEAGSRVEANVHVAGLEVQALRGLLDLQQLPLTGRMSGQAVVTAQGDALNQALRTARASAVVTMAGGSVSRQIVQLGSTDLRALFGGTQGMVPVSCILGVLDVRGGIGTVTPIRLRTAEGTIAGHGTVDLVRRRLDLTIESESGTTGFLALDIPVRVSGSFSAPAFAPAQLSAAGRAQAASGDEIGRLLPALQTVARASPCLGRR